MGSYSISWGASSGSVTAYELYRSTNASFSGAVRVYSGSTRNVTLSGRGNGTYYYRVRACNTTAVCSGFRTGGNAITVTVPPSVPPSISVPSSSTTGNYSISWGASSGTLTTYQLFEATNASFTGAVQVYSGTARSFAFSGRDSGTYYYRVRACNGTAACSGYRTGTTALSVNVPIQVLSPTIQVTTTGMTTSIGTLANLRGNPATIQSFSLSSCPNTSAQILSGAQSVRWNNGNYYYWQCEPAQSAQCSASFVIRNSNTGQLHSGSAAVVVRWQARDLLPGMQCH